eukprot:80471-Pleurochrysis_carterae.AAC.1
MENGGRGQLLVPLPSVSTECYVRLTKRFGRLRANFTGLTVTPRRVGVNSCRLEYGKQHSVNLACGSGPGRAAHAPLRCWHTCAS